MYEYTNKPTRRRFPKVPYSRRIGLLGEIGSSFVLGLGKSTVITMWESPAALTTYGSTALTQGGIAGYGAYAAGKVAVKYLEGGCSWGNLGPSTVIQDILATVEPNTIIYRLRQELETKL